MSHTLLFISERKLSGDVNNSHSDDQKTVFRAKATSIMSDVKSSHKLACFNADSSDALEKPLSPKTLLLSLVNVKAQASENRKEIASPQISVSS